MVLPLVPLTARHGTADQQFKRLRRLQAELRARSLVDGRPDGLQMRARQTAIGQPGQATTT